MLDAGRRSCRARRSQKENGNKISARSKYVCTANDEHTYLEVAVSLGGDVSGDSDGRASVGDSPRELRDVRGLVGGETKVGVSAAVFDV